MRRSGKSVSVVGLGTWQLGADWGDVAEDDALAVLDAAVAGRRHLLRHRRRLRRRPQRAADRPVPGRDPGLRSDRGHQDGPPRRAARPENYILDNFRAWTDRSRAQPGRRPARPGPAALPADRRLLPTTPSSTRSTPWSPSSGSPPTASASRPATEALTAIARPGTASVQIILNAFRRKPLEQVLPAAQAAGVGIIARVPLASGLLSGRYTTRHPVPPPTTTAATTGTARRSTRGETFSGVDFETGVEAAARVRRPAARRDRPGRGRAALDHPAARRHHGDPRRPQPGAGQAERRGRQPAPAHRGRAARDRGPLRPAHPAPRCTTAGSRGVRPAPR